MIGRHLPILLIALPLVSAPLCVLLRRRAPAWGLAAVVSWLTLGMAGALLAEVLRSGPVSYALGSWSAPWGIEYRIDAVNAFVLLLVSLIGAVVVLFAPGSIAGELPKARGNLFYAAWLLCLTGQLGMVATGDAFNVFVFLEISSLSAYALVGMGPDRRALSASFRYLVMGTIGGTFFVTGVGLLYMMTGTLNMADMAERLPPVMHTRTVLAAFAFLSIGLSLKLALFPMHLWLPDAYAYAPSAVTAFLAATATKVAVYVFLRFFFTIFGGDYAFGTLNLDYLLIPLALAGVFAGSLAALFQHNVKRMLAYSSVAQVGYMMLGIGLFSVTGLTATLVHLFNHALMKGTLFLAMGCVACRIGSVELEDLRGLGKRMPLTAAAFVAGGLSLIGVPLTAGFISKWYLVLAALERGMWPVAVLVLAGSLIAVAYVWRVVEAAYFREPAGESGIAEAPLSMQIPLWILVAANFYFGLATDTTAGVAGQGARLLMGTAP